MNQSRPGTTPPDLRKVLAAHPDAKAQWADLTELGRRDFLSWINTAKQPETRKRRVESIPSRLASGKRRPCCFAVVPFDLLDALSANPKAKARWKALASVPRRDFIDWIDAAKDRPMRSLRLEKACALIAAGKPAPK